MVPEQDNAYWRPQANGRSWLFGNMGETGQVVRSSSQTGRTRADGTKAAPDPKQSSLALMDLLVERPYNLRHELQVAVAFMAEERVQRRLAAILAVDMVGYSRLMGADEAGTVARQKAHRAEIIDPAIAQHNGRIVKTTGDGLLVEFGSAVDAVDCAVAVQRAVAEREAKIDQDRSIAYRIGINQGDIIIDGEDIFGDGVNVAARLEGLSDPGGICISGKVYDEVCDRVNYAFEDKGERQVKNITRPVRVWRLRDGVRHSRSSPEAEPKDRKPVLAVLSFEFLGDDPELSNLGRVLTRDLIIEMDGRTGFKLVAGTTVARFERDSDRAIDAVRDSLGADFVLCGSVTGNAERVRVQAELIETAGGAQIWAERYDRKRGDLLSLADDLTDVIAQASRTASNAYIGSLYEERPDETLTNNERLAKAAHYFYQLTPNGHDRALEQIDRVLASEADNAMALTMRAIALGIPIQFDLLPPSKKLVDEVDTLLDRALALEPRSDVAFWIRGWSALYLKGQVDAALADAERSLELNPHYSLGIGLKGQALCYAGRVEEGVVHLKRAIDIERRETTVAWFEGALAVGLFIAGEPAEALKSLDLAIRTGRPLPEFGLVRAAVLEELGRHDEAVAELALLTRKYPNIAMGKLRLPPFANPEQRHHFTENLRAAGMPD
jgi:adenylate cyclase